ncbi:NucA/NucB deoxyribonuclease domain-containing protein [Paenibacillus wulumuqiensis]|uniref:NucA/NucB deoxyribonuclease domain-containing protein n=1 Tax=Paenibacillus wulumuqiensis TaxID=1567107 RepID=UPI0006192138|nr:NucA/NucB deoxyribonuclease domain-containing protein [Paenibacillus wulumuqiensis]
MSPKRIGAVVSALVVVVAIYLFTGKVDLGSLTGALNPSSSSMDQNEQADYTLVFPKNRYPKTGDHIKDAIAAGESAICTIDRKGAKENRRESLKGIETRKGYDRDEWPMAMCKEGGAGADIRYVTPSDNRGAGSWISNQLDNYPDGTRVLIEVK